MKRSLIYVLIITLILSSGIVSFASNNKPTSEIESRDKKVIDVLKITEHKRNILHAYGLTDTEINELTIKELKELLSKGEVIDSSKLYDKSTLDNVFEEEKMLIEQIMASKGVSASELDELAKYYTLESLLNANSKDLEFLKTKVLTSNEIKYKNSELYYSSPLMASTTSITLPSGQIYDEYGCELNDLSCGAPDQYICISTIPYGGGSHESIYVNNLRYSTINQVASNAREMASRIFQKSTSLVVATYYLWSEWGEGYVWVDGVQYDASTWLHEGVDMQTTSSNKSVYSPLDYGYAKVVWSDSTTVCIYDSVLEVTIAYQHVNNSLSKGDIIPAYGLIGTQSGNHVHVGVIDGKYENAPWTGVLSGRDMTLETISPYGYINFYDKN